MYADVISSGADVLKDRKWLILMYADVSLSEAEAVKDRIGSFPCKLI